MSVNRKNIPSYFLWIFLFFMMCSGVIGYLAVEFSTPILKLWKEMFVTFTFLLFLVLTLHRVPIRLIYVFYFIICFFIIGFVNSLTNTDMVYVAYQLKMDFFIVLFGLVVYLALINLSKESLEKFIQKSLRIIILLGGLNSIAMVLERTFFVKFLNIVGLKEEQWGSDSGIKIIAAAGELRAPGLLLTFVASGALMLVCFILLIEARKIHNFGKFMILILSPLFIIGVYYSTYKTAQIGISFYLVIKLVEFIFQDRNGSFAVTVMISSLAWIYLFVSTHFMGIYYFVAKYSPYYAYNSIYLRVVQHQQILSQFDTIKDFLFGVGMGANGRFGLERAANVPATDSTYIYLTSNYGIVFIIMYTAFMFVLLYKLFKYKQFDIVGARYLLLYIMIIEFFYNNSFVNFPINYIIVFLVTFAVIYKKVCQTQSIENAKKKAS